MARRLPPLVVGDIEAGRGSPRGQVSALMKFGRGDIPRWRVPDPIALTSEVVKRLSKIK